MNAPAAIDLRSQFRFIIALLHVCVGIEVRAASAQAFLPPKGEGNFTVAYQNLFARGHLDLNGDRMPGESGVDRVYTHAIVWEAEYGVADRFAVNVAVPYIQSRYDGLAPHRPGGTGPIREWDDGTYHGTFQDFQLGARYRLTSHPATLTMFAEGIIPSHHYPSVAHAAVGRDLRALVVGAAAGGFLDAVLPRLFFQGQISYAVVQELVDIRPNRSRVDSEVGYFITPRLAVRFLESYQITHHGMDVLTFSPMVDGVIHDHPEIQLTSEHRRNHDRLQRSNFLTLGGGVSFAVTNSLDLFVNVVNTVWGENVHPLRGITIGVSTHFRSSNTVQASPK